MEQILQNIRDAFQLLKDKKILIYGSGIMAQRVVSALAGFQLVGILDRVRLEGEVSGIPILAWEDIRPEDADIIILGTSAENYREIYERIFYTCIHKGIEIWGSDGKNLSEYYRIELLGINRGQYYLKNKEELKKKIDAYEAVSFDLFDTLLMRRTLEPLDIFDLVEWRLKAKGIEIKEFKKKRRTAELESGGKDIYCIYEILAQRLKWDQAMIALVMDEEIQCEREYLLPRTVMVELLQYAVSQGKIVSIITDMYLTGPILADILNAMGISGYSKLYISCEYGKGKGNGLFAEYLKDLKEKRCLHIGDNRQADILAAEENGIDTYEIKSAYDMFKISGFRKLLAYIDNKCDRLFLGNMAAELFNDPFALYLTFGSVRIKTLKSVIRIFVLPVIIQYMQELYRLIKAGTYQGILFGARDGYLLKKIYDAGLVGNVDDKPKSIYFYTARKLAVKAAVYQREDIKEFLNYLGPKADGQKVLNQMFYLEGNETDMEQYLTDNLQRVLKQAALTRKNYFRYMERNGIDCHGKYLFCDLVSAGTVQNALDKLFSAKLTGIYLYRGTGRVKRDILVDSVYSMQEWRHDQYHTNFLEKILTSPEPTVIDMTEEGTPVFAKESRDVDEIKFLKQMQNLILQEIDEFTNALQWDKQLNKELTGSLLELMHYSIFEGEADILNHLKLIDDMTMQENEILLEKY